MIYAIDENKVHRRVNIAEAERLHDAGHKIVQADADGWIEWNGGECPLPDGVKYDVRCASGSEGRQSNPQEDNWLHVHGDSNIIAYRPIFNAEEAKMKQGNAESHLVAGQEYEYSFTMFQHPVGVDMRDAVKFIGMDGSQAVVRTSRGTLVHTSAGCLRAVRSDRDRWIEAAMALADCPDRAPLIHGYFEAIHDALASGELPTPEQTK